MHMTDEEIKYRYHSTMSLDENRLKVLAELNCCKPEDIARILNVPYHKRLYNNRHKPDAINHEIAWRMYHLGARDEDIAIRFNVCTSTVRTWRVKNHLSPHQGRRPQKGVPRLKNED